MRWGEAPFQSYGEIAARRLSGRTRWRFGWFGRLVLQVEIISPIPRYPAAPPPPGSQVDYWTKGAYTFWRDATLDDSFEAKAP